MDKKPERRTGLAAFTHARIALGHSGGHLKTVDWLNFQKDFVQAKDAVNGHFEGAPVLAYCAQKGLATMELQSMANQLQIFLLRPDLGRQLTNESEILLKDNKENGKDLLIIVSGGLSPIAINNHAVPFLSQFLARQNWSIAPIVIMNRSRVAIGDQINQFAQAKMVVMLIGERPGLSSADSMGIYVTYGAKPGCDDSQRNCISNIHARGLSYTDAADMLVRLLRQAFRQQRTGILLKDDAEQK